jgi:hypothetical protein
VKFFGFGNDAARVEPTFGAPGNSNKPHGMGAFSSNILSLTNYKPQLPPPNFYELLNLSIEDREIIDTMGERFTTVGEMAELTIKGQYPSMIFSGPAGVGKSFTVSKMLKKYDPKGRYSISVKGYMRPPALYKLLYQYRASGQTIIIDDCDSVFDDQTALNLLKAALDSEKIRTVDYRSQVRIKGDNGETLPSSFQFAGSVIFLTNKDFERDVEDGKKNAEHFAALMSRSLYVTLKMTSKRHYFLRIVQVMQAGMLRSNGFSDEVAVDVANYINDNYTAMRELSLREAGKIAALRKEFPDNWKNKADMSCLKGASSI